MFVSKYTNASRSEKTLPEIRSENLILVNDPNNGISQMLNGGGASILGGESTNFETVTQEGRIVKMMTLHTKQSNSIS